MALVIKQKYKSTKTGHTLTIKNIEEDGVLIKSTDGTEIRYEALKFIEAIEGMHYQLVSTPDFTKLELRLMKVIDLLPSEEPIKLDDPVRMEDLIAAMDKVDCTRASTSKVVNQLKNKGFIGIADPRTEFYVVYMTEKGIAPYLDAVGKATKHLSSEMAALIPA
jgi:hypothetical protein